MKPRSLGLAFAASLAALIPAAATTALTPLPIQSISISGSACPPGTVAQAFSPDRTAFTITFAQYIAMSGPSVPASEHSKTCRFDITLTLPNGWHVTGAEFYQLGFVSLAPGMTASADLATTINGKASGSDASVAFTEPLSSNYFVQTTLDAHRGLGRCNGATQTLSILAPISIGRAAGSPSATSLITSDSLDGAITIAPCAD